MLIHELLLSNGEGAEFIAKGVFILSHNDLSNFWAQSVHKFNFPSVIKNYLKVLLYIKWLDFKNWLDYHGFLLHIWPYFKIIRSGEFSQNPLPVNHHPLLRAPPPSLSPLLRPSLHPPSEVLMNLGHCFASKHSWHQPDKRWYGMSIPACWRAETQ